MIISMAKVLCRIRYVYQRVSYGTFFFYGQTNCWWFLQLPGRSFGTRMRYWWSTLEYPRGLWSNPTVANCGHLQIWGEHDGFSFLVPSTFRHLFGGYFIGILSMETIWRLYMDISIDISWITSSTCRPKKTRHDSKDLQWVLPDSTSKVDTNQCSSKTFHEMWTETTHRKRGLGRCFQMIDPGWTNDLWTSSIILSKTITLRYVLDVAD